MKAYRRVVLHILSLNIGLRWQVNLTPRALYTQGKTSVTFE